MVPVIRPEKSFSLYRMVALALLVEGELSGRQVGDSRGLFGQTSAKVIPTSQSEGALIQDNLINAILGQ